MDADFDKDGYASHQNKYHIKSYEKNHSTYR